MGRDIVGGIIGGSPDKIDFQFEVSEDTIVPDKESIEIDCALKLNDGHPLDDSTLAFIKDIGHKLWNNNIFPTQIEVIPRNHHPETGHPPYVLAPEWLLPIHNIHEKIYHLRDGKAKNILVDRLNENNKRAEIIDLLKDDAELRKDLEIDADVFERMQSKYQPAENWGQGDRSILNEPLSFFYTLLTNNITIDLKDKTEEKCNAILQIYQRTGHTTAPSKEYPKGRTYGDPEYDDDSQYWAVQGELKRLRMKYRKGIKK